VQARERCGSTVQADLTVGNGGRKVAKQPRIMNTEGGDTVMILECRPYRPSNSADSAITKSRATKATTLAIA